MTRVSAIRLVATFDLLESLRSRKAVALLVLYLFGALGATGLFIRFLHTVQRKLVEQFGEEATLAKLMESPDMAKVATEAIGDVAIAEAIINTPPLALFYGWFAMILIPLLVLLTSSDTISGDLATGSVRFSLFRVDRLSWAIGKFAGQTCLMIVGALVGAIGCWLAGVIWLEQMPIAATAWWMLRFAGRAAVYGFAYLGMAMCASQLTRTNWPARGLALLFMFMASLVGGILQLEPIQKQYPDLFAALARLFPNGHHLDLWHPDVFWRSMAMAGLILIGIAWFALGYLRFSRRDA